MDTKYETLVRIARVTNSWVLGRVLPLQTIFYFDKGPKWWGEYKSFFSLSCHGNEADEV